jgi:hypothetical protein
MLLPRQHWYLPGTRRQPTLEQLDACRGLLVREPAGVHLTTLGVAGAGGEVKQTRRTPDIEELRQIRAEVAPARSQTLAGLEVPVASVARNEPECTLHRAEPSHVLAHRTPHLSQTQAYAYQRSSDDKEDRRSRPPGCAVGPGRRPTIGRTGPRDGLGRRGGRTAVSVGAEKQWSMGAWLAREERARIVLGSKIARLGVR